jgi:acyl carrier protein
MNTPEGPPHVTTNTSIRQGAAEQRVDAVVHRIRPRTPEEVQEWFLAYLAQTLQAAPDRIDIKAPFEVLGLDSVTAVGMSGDLQAWLGFSVDPMVVFDYPTIESLSTHLAECSRTNGSSA